MTNETNTNGRRTQFRPTGPSGLMEHARNVLTVDRVFGEPIEQDGTLLIPAAAIRGAGGAGGGGGENQRGEEGIGEGLGYATSARPVGAYVMRNGQVTWQPAIDLQRILVAGTLTFVALLGFRWLTKRGQARSQVKIAKYGS